MVVIVVITRAASSFRYKRNTDDGTIIGGRLDGCVDGSAAAGCLHGRINVGRSV